MSTAALLLLDDVLVAAVAVAWPVAAYALRRGGRWWALAPALVLTAARVGVAVALAGSGWWFAADRLLLAVPLVSLPALVVLYQLVRQAAAPGLLRQAAPGPGPGVDPRVVLLAAYGGLAGVLVALVVTHPVRPVHAGLVVALVAGAGALTWRGPRRPGKAGTAAGVALLCFALVWAVAAVSASRVPERLNLGAHAMAQPLTRGRPTVLAAGRAAGAPVRQVSTLREPPGAPDRRFTLTAREATITLASGRRVPAWTFDGTVPGPTLRAEVGELVEVRLVNRMPELAVTLHWHGYPVRAGDDGVAGVTQDAVRPGGEFVYRFRATQPGTFWYHSHDLSDPAVRMGLFGLLVVSGGASEAVEHTVVLHELGGAPVLAVDGSAPAEGVVRQAAEPGSRVRLRVAVTANTPALLGLSGVPYRLAAVDGRELTRPGQLRGERLRLAAGGRYDLVFTMPPAGAVALSAGNRLLVLGDGPAPAPPAGALLDITAYAPAGPPPPRRFDREVTWVLDRRLTLLDGLPRPAHTVNGRVWPDIEAPVVREGELIKITVANRGRDTHPMHPHGHEVLVLSRNGRPAGHLRMDTFDVAPGEVWEVALRADNPGVWMSHCHDLSHAALGMTFHLAYEGVGTPFDAGRSSGNHPE
ncbi:multicopper oxidase family protein [Nonomuraea sp. NPDC050310]|uniref:multicopper oxidase family protein n=1 Tax=Nonomuraea sp. NPDC050310 TaxID=3154935 RepID=UPI0033DF757B